MTRNTITIIKEIQWLTKRTAEIEESVLTGSKFDKQRQNETDFIKRELENYQKDIAHGWKEIGELAPEIKSALNTIEVLRTRSEKKAEIKKLGAIEAKEHALPQQSFKGELTQEEINKRLGISPEMAARIKANPEEAQKEIQENLRKLHEEAEKGRKQKETAKKKRFLR